MKAIKRLLDECDRQGTDVFGFIHYIEKELVEDAKREYEHLTAERKKQGRIHKRMP